MPLASSSCELHSVVCLLPLQSAHATVVSSLCSLAFPSKDGCCLHSRCWCKCALLMTGIRVPRIDISGCDYPGHNGHSIGTALESLLLFVRGRSPPNRTGGCTPTNCPRLSCPSLVIVRLLCLGPFIPRLLTADPSTALLVAPCNAFINTGLDLPRDCP